MAAYVRDTMQHKYYRDTEGGKREIMEKHLGGEKRKQPSRIPYFMSFTKVSFYLYQLAFLHQAHYLQFKATISLCDGNCIMQSELTSQLEDFMDFF